MIELRYTDRRSGPLVENASTRADAIRPSVSRQRVLGNQAIQRMAGGLEVDTPGDRYERQADRVAERVMGTSGADVSRPAERRSRGGAGGGDPLPEDVREFMEPRLGADFSQVRVHTDPEAARMNRDLHARAFTHRQHIYFAEGSSPGRDATTVHELAHVVQQTSGASVPDIQRTVEVRPPGPGEASAFGRRQELIDRLNKQSPAIQYRLQGQVLLYTVIDATKLGSFDRRMRDFIDRSEVVPMRLITSAGRISGDSVFVDTLQSGYVDLEDLLASPGDLSFQLNLIHILTERFRVRNYERRIGTNMDRDFDRAHRAGVRAEAEHLREVIGDPTLRFHYEENKASGTVVFAFQSDEGYRVFHVFRRTDRAVVGGDVFVQLRDGTRLTVDELRARRAGP